MTTVNYTAKRSIIAGHVADDTYDLDMKAGKNNRLPETDKEQHESVGGRLEIIRYKQSIEFDVTTIRILSTDLPAWYEFLDSTDGGEVFTFDRYGTAAVPVDPISVKRVGDYKEARHGTTMTFRISFRVRAV
ncbi:MAG: hypothetical protein RRB22_01100 [Gammaproteobacteria bacterium]|nr:hypothetical protein [Gammaproteobacteria bacterium]